MKQTEKREAVSPSDVCDVCVVFAHLIYCMNELHFEIIASHFRAGGHSMHTHTHTHEFVYGGDDGQTKQKVLKWWT